MMLTASVPIAFTAGGHSSGLLCRQRPYLHAVVHETLRLYPSVPMELKMAVNDDILPDGTFVPAGSCVSFSPYMLGRSRGLWGPDAADFKPGRWLDEEGAFQRQSQYKFTGTHQHLIH